MKIAGSGLKRPTRRESTTSERYGAYPRSAQRTSTLPHPFDTTPSFRPRSDKSASTRTFCAPAARTAAANRSVTRCLNSVLSRSRCASCQATCLSTMASRCALAIDSSTAARASAASNALRRRSRGTRTPASAYNAAKRSSQWSPSPSSVPPISKSTACTARTILWGSAYHSRAEESAIRATLPDPERQQRNVHRNEDERKEPFKMMDPRESTDRIETRVVAEKIPTADRPVEARAVPCEIHIAHRSAWRPGRNRRFYAAVNPGEAALHAFVGTEHTASPGKKIRGVTVAQNDAVDREARVRIAKVIVQLCVRGEIGRASCRERV